MKNFQKLGLTEAQFEMLKQRIKNINDNIVLEDIFLTNEEAIALCVSSFSVRTASYSEGIYVQFIFAGRTEIGEIFGFYDYRDAGLYKATRENFARPISWDDERPHMTAN